MELHTCSSGVESESDPKMTSAVWDVYLHAVLGGRKARSEILQRELVALIMHGFKRLLFPLYIYNKRNSP